MAHFGPFDENPYDNSYFHSWGARQKKGSQQPHKPPLEGMELVGAWIGFLLWIGGMILFGIWLEGV